MPYYRWRGVNLMGTIKRGVLFARSAEHLDELLLKRQLALLSHKQMRQWISRPIKLSNRLQLFQQLATLIDAGVLIPDALLIIANQTEHPQLQEKMHTVAQMVIAGISLSDALEDTGAIASPIIIQLIKAGEESGKLPLSLDAICAHLSATQDFYRRLRSALMLPAITLLFFFVIIVIIFTIIMPRFIEIFTSMQAEIPPLTQTLLSISAFMRSSAMGLIVAIGTLIALVMWRITRKGKPRRILDSALLKTPVVGELLTQRFLSYMMRALAVLLEGGMPLSQALAIVRSSVQNHCFIQYLQNLENDIMAGNSLSGAMAHHGEGLFSPDTIAMIEVGEESGRLPILLMRASDAYHMRVIQRLSWLTMLLQPTVMIILGMLVALLIFAVYGPIFNMSRIF